MILCVGDSLNSLDNKNIFKLVKNNKNGKITSIYYCCFSVVVVGTFDFNDSKFELVKKSKQSFFDFGIIFHEPQKTTQLINKVKARNHVT